MLVPSIGFSVKAIPTKVDRLQTASYEEKRQQPFLLDNISNGDHLLEIHNHLPSLYSVNSKSLINYDRRSDVLL